jgi:MYXO-CTERM domain-containing protein
MFRIGLYNVNGSADDLGWLGYIATNGDATLGGRIFERPDPNTTSFTSTTGLTALATATAPGVNFESGAASTYNFSLMLTRVATGIQIDSSIIRTSDSVQMGGGSFLDTTLSVTDFNRAGFLLGGNLDVDTVQFTNITVVPEPSAALLGGLGLLALLRRRRN